MDLSAENAIQITCLTKVQEKTENDKSQEKNIVEKYLENIVVEKNDLENGLAISEADFFIKEPIYNGKWLLLIGQNFIHQINIDKNSSEIKSKDGIDFNLESSSEEDEGETIRQQQLFKIRNTSKIKKQFIRKKGYNSH